MLETTVAILVIVDISLIVLMGRVIRRLNQEVYDAYVTREAFANLQQRLDKTTNAQPPCV
jgi:hypothetical protein